MLAYPTKLLGYANGKRRRYDRQMLVQLYKADSAIKQGIRTGQQVNQNWCHTIQL